MRTFTVTHKGFVKAVWEILLDGSEPVTQIVSAFCWFASKPGFSLDGAEFQLLAEGWANQKYSLFRDGIKIASFRTEGFWNSKQIIEFADRRMEFKWKGFWKSKLELTENDQPIGEAGPDGFWGTTTRVALPDDISLPESIFIVWVDIKLVAERSSAATTG